MFAFDRTVSRLLEMQSEGYVQASLSAHPQGQSFMKKLLAPVFSQSYIIKSTETTSNAPLDSDSLSAVELEKQMQILVDKLLVQYRIGTIDENSVNTSSFSDKQNNNISTELDGILTTKSGTVAASTTATAAVTGPTTPSMVSLDAAVVCLSDLIDCAYKHNFSSITTSEALNPTHAHNHTHKQQQQLGSTHLIDKDGHMVDTGDCCKHQQQQQLNALTELKIIFAESNTALCSK